MSVLMYMKRLSTSFHICSNKHARARPRAARTAGSGCRGRTETQAGLRSHVARWSTLIQRDWRASPLPSYCMIPPIALQLDSFTNRFQTPGCLSCYTISGA